MKRYQGCKQRNPSYLFNWLGMCWRRNYAMAVFLVFSGGMLFIADKSNTWARGDEFVETVEAGAHGGQMRKGGSYRFELLAKDGVIQVWVTDRSDRPISMEGTSGKVLIINRSQIGLPYVLALLPGGENRLIAKDGRIKKNGDARIMLNATVRGEMFPVRYWEPTNSSIGAPCIVDRDAYK